MKVVTPTNISKPDMLRGLIAGHGVGKPKKEMNHVADKAHNEAATKNLNSIKEGRDKFTEEAKKLIDSKAKEDGDKNKANIAAMDKTLADKKLAEDAKLAKDKEGEKRRKEAITDTIRME